MIVLSIFYVIATICQIKLLCKSGPSAEVYGLMNIPWEWLCPAMKFFNRYKRRFRTIVDTPGSVLTDIKGQITINILSYNACLFGGRTLLKWHAFYEYERRQKIIEYLKADSDRIDIICLQEVFSDNYRDYLVRSVKGIYPHSLHVKSPV